MILRKLKKNYVSKIDQFLAEFDHKRPTLSASQKAEIKKHERIFRLRDQALADVDAAELWEDF